MPNYWFDVGRGPLVLTAKVTATSKEEALEGLQGMLRYRFGGGDSCSINTDGGQLGDGPIVGDIGIFIRPDDITMRHLANTDE